MTVWVGRADDVAVLGLGVSEQLLESRIINVLKVVLGILGDPVPNPGVVDEKEYPVRFPSVVAVVLARMSNAEPTFKPCQRGFPVR